MKYDDDFMKTSSNAGSNMVKPVGIIKKTSSYRPPVLIPNRPPIDTTDRAHNFDDLVVVGYSSNLYRDDFMALKLESRDILIPWNGDQNLLIDRYDCRGYLYDLEPYDADLMTDDRRNPKLTAEETEIERTCDLERYMFLKEDESVNDDDGASSSRDSDDIDTWKRYASIAFNYSTDTTDTSHPNGDETIQEEKPNEKLFVPDDALKLPVGMLVPETVKMNQIVVKTASFVAKQGLQMEILLKTKQANNSQFDFLNFDSHLNPYYKHLIQLIRDNKIDPLVYLVETKEDDKKSNDDQDDDEENSDDDHYLHPLLFKTIETPVSKKEPEKLPETKLAEDVKSEDEKTTHESKNEVAEEHLEEPEGVTKTIIDKLAEYVARNGREFEETVVKKDPEKFEFVKPGHKYHRYYCSVIEATMNKDEDRGRGKKRTNSRSSEDSESSSSSSSNSGEESDRERKRSRESERRKKRKKEKKSHHSKKSSSSHHHKSKKKHHHRKKSRDRH